MLDLLSCDSEVVRSLQESFKLLPESGGWSADPSVNPLNPPNLPFAAKCSEFNRHFSHQFESNGGTCRDHARRCPKAAMRSKSSAAFTSHSEHESRPARGDLRDSKQLVVSFGDQDDRQSRPVFNRYSPGIMAFSCLSQRMGSCTVTNLVPSGNVASTCTSGIISGTPSIQSSRVRIGTAISHQIRYAHSIPRSFHELGG